MKPSTYLTASAVALAAAVAAIAPAVAQDTPGDLRDMVNARAGQAEGELGRRGYVWVRVEDGSDRKWAYWWNASTRICVTIMTTNGKYAAITTSPAPDCRQSADGYRPPNRPGPGYGNDRPGYDRPGYGGGNNRPGYGGPGNGGGYGDSYRDDGSLTLICYGEGRKPGLEYRSGYDWNPRTNRYEYRGGYQSGTDNFDSQVQVEIFRGRGRIHLTGKLVAPIHSGDRNGWWDLQDLQIDRDRITGKYRLNGLNSPKVDIDRRSGRIRIDGIEHFRGDCDVGDWGDNSNRF